MFGMIPLAYKNQEAAKLAAQAYELEDGAEWIVVVKQVQSGDNNFINWYQPCKKEDLYDAINDGFQYHSILLEDKKK